MGGMSENESEQPPQNDPPPPAEEQTNEPVEGKEEAPAQDKGEAPTEDKDEAPAQDKGEASTEDKDEAPAQDKDEAPGEDQAEEPGEDKSTPPAEAQAQAPDPDATAEVAAPLEDDHPFAREEAPKIEPTSFLPVAITLCLVFFFFWTECADKATEDLSPSQSNASEEVPPESAPPADSPASEPSNVEDAAATESPPSDSAEGSSADTAAPAATSATPIAVGDPPEVLNQARSLQSQSKHEDAIRSLNAVVELAPMVPELYDLRAESHETLGNRKQAELNRRAAEAIRSGTVRSAPPGRD